MVDFRLYLVTDRERCEPRALQAVVREACDAGVRAVQMRERGMYRGEMASWCERLLEITRPRGSKLFVNVAGMHPADAAGMHPDGLHLPDAAPFPTTRFPGLTIGVSTHDANRARKAEADGADFITFGPVYSTPSKKRYGAPQGTDALATVCAAVSIPVFAIGGVTPERVAECTAAGAHGVAVIGAVMGAADVAEAVAEFSRALGSL